MRGGRVAAGQAHAEVGQAHADWAKNAAIMESWIRLQGNPPSPMASLQTCNTMNLHLHSTQVSLLRALTAQGGNDEEL